MSSQPPIAVLGWLRFPLALAVVFIHSFGNPPLCAECVSANPASQESLFALFRVLFSRALPCFAVPLFFAISGFLFFYRMPGWSWKAYGGKLQRRSCSLLAPYLLWITLYALHLSPKTVGGVLAGSMPLSALAVRFHTLGGWHIFWDSHLFGTATGLLGNRALSTGPLLAPLWFVRDLMVLVLFAPLLYQLLKRMGALLLAVVAICHLANVWIPLAGFSPSSTLWFLVGAYFSVKGKDFLSGRIRYRKWCAVAAIVLLLPLVWVNVIEVLDVVKRMTSTVYDCVAMVAVVGFVQGGFLEGRLRERPLLSRSSFFVYTSHIFFLTPVMRCVGQIAPAQPFVFHYFSYLLTPLLTVFACFLLYATIKATSKVISKSCSMP